CRRRPGRGPCPPRCSWPWSPPPPTCSAPCRSATWWPAPAASTCCTPAAATSAPLTSAGSSAAASASSSSCSTSPRGRCRRPPPGAPVTRFSCLGPSLAVAPPRANLSRLYRGTENRFKDTPAMLLLSKTLHVLALGLWFGAVTYFTFGVGLQLFGAFEELAAR